MNVGFHIVHVDKRKTWKQAIENNYAYENNIDKIDYLFIYNKKN